MRVQRSMEGQRSEGGEDKRKQTLVNEGLQWDHVRHRALPGQVDWNRTFPTYACWSARTSPLQHDVKLWSGCDPHPLVV